MGKRILVVDDESRIVDTIREYLSQHGYEVHAAGDARQALELVRQETFDAAILDFHLPDMDGVALHRNLREIDESLGDRTLFTSGLVQSDANLQYYSDHGLGFLAKPFRMREVLDALGRLLGA